MWLYYYLHRYFEVRRVKSNVPNAIKSQGNNVEKNRKFSSVRKTNFLLQFFPWQNDDAAVKITLVWIKRNYSKIDGQVYLHLFENHRKSRIQHCERSELCLQKFIKNAKNWQFGEFLKNHMRHFGWFLNTVHHRKNQIKTSTVIGFASICKDATQKNTFGFFGWCILCIGYTCRVLCNNEANNMQNKTKTKLKRKAKILNLLSDLRKNPSCFSLTKRTPSFSNLCEGWPKARAATSLLLNLILPEDRTACK